MASSPEASLAAARLVARVEFLGMLDDVDGGHVVDRHFLLLVFSKLSSAGVGREDRLLLSSAREPEDYRKLLERALEQTEHSPLPDSEWHPLGVTLGEDVLANLLGISPASVRRYSRQERVTPDDVAARLHFLALLVADLSGAYNNYGIRRWFDRPRLALGGKVPRALLGADFEPGSDDGLALRRLAAGLVGAGAT